MRPRNISRLASLAVAAILAFAVTVFGQGRKGQPQEPADATREADDERDPKLANWQWLVEVAAPKEPKGAYLAADLTAEVLGRARMERQQEDEQPADVRLVDAAGRRLPYVPRVLRNRLVQRPVTVARRFDAGPNASGQYFQVSLELKDVQPPGHSEIEVRTPGRNFRRKIEVFGANDAAFKEEQRLLPENAFVIDFDAGERRLIVDRFRYDFKQFPFLKVRVYADPVLGEKPPSIGDVTVRRSDRTAGKYLSYPVRLGDPESVHAGDGPGTAWYIELGGERTFCEKLSLETAPGSPAGVERPFRLQRADRDEGRYDLPGVDWRWRREGERDVLDLSFGEVYAQRLRLVVTDYANPPLQLAKAEATMAARQVIFERPRDDAWPLRLYFGNPTAPAANFDLRQKLPLHFEPAVASVGARQTNPEYQPPPRRVDERYPWLVYLVLGAACVVLAGLLVPLGRQALAGSAANASG